MHTGWRFSVAEHRLFIAVHSRHISGVMSMAAAMRQAMGVTSHWLVRQLLWCRQPSSQQLQMPDGLPAVQVFCINVVQVRLINVWQKAGAKLQLPVLQLIDAHSLPEHCPSTACKLLKGNG